MENSITPVFERLAQNLDGHAGRFLASHVYDQITRRRQETKASHTKRMAISVKCIHIHDFL